ncbi:transposase [Pseudonocardia sp. NPDC049635]|uniref:transposase n=1 Tax=Pseudonocardia sp. NPDC049635 TaxID=3155506 RepID=UPI0034102922
MVRDIKVEPGGSAKGACRRVGDQLCIDPETLRGWVNQAEIDDGDRPGVGTDQATRLAELERENRELRRANAILKSASGCSSRYLSNRSAGSR